MAKASLPMSEEEDTKAQRRAGEFPNATQHPSLQRQGAKGRCRASVQGIVVWHVILSLTVLLDHWFYIPLHYLPSLKYTSLPFLLLCDLTLPHSARVKT